ncbi:putative trans-sialidase [Trypanosoma cruzi Dm28c]|uniref:Putative trans-sialidase n=2 Tax=Trypanosoma cruzi TaxID=5693 RepID=V5B3S3_TRYCR|nr:putative trans-sialidase [Trypanosoma cruzi Dm28c]
MVSVLLTAQLQRVKEVLATWKKVDDIVSMLCPSEEDGSSDTACRDFKITDGLVGFLSGKFSENTWRDEYLGVNATVKKKDGAKKATLHEGGVKFTGAWAEWPVGSQGENQLYHFANYNFTLVATVSIHGVPKEEGSPIPLMGVKVDDDKKTVLLGLSYDSEKKWKLSCGGGTDTEDQSVTLATETTHHVVTLLRNGNQGSAYVDGERVGGDEACELKVTEPNEISHFYIGGDGNSARSEEGVSVTVTNVLLYNRPLDDDEITALNPNKAPIPKAKGTETAVLEARLTPASGSVAQQTVSLPTPAGPLLAEQESSTMSSGVGGVGVSTSRETTVTNPLPGLDSVQQLASVKSSDGSQSVNAASSSVGDKTVGRGAGDETQNDETHQPSMDTSATADTNTPTAKGVGHDGTAVDQVMNASSREDEEATRGTDGQEDNHARDGEVNATVLSSLGNVSQGNNSDAGTVRGSGLLPSLPLLLGLWVFAAL